MTDSTARAVPSDVDPAPMGRRIADMPCARHINRTPFPSQYFQTVDADNTVHHVLALRITYDMRSRREDGSMRYAAVQTPLQMQDRWSDKVNESSPLWESDLAPHKPRCDVLVVNAVSRPPPSLAQNRVRRLVTSDVHATAKRWDCAVALRWTDEDGSTRDWHKQLAITGPRTRGLRRMGTPEPAAEVPICWERAYGGEDKQPATDVLRSDGSVETAAGDDAWTTDERNPVGVGFTGRRGEAGPQLELSPQSAAPAAERETLPASLLPLGRAWLPRRTLAGTYDDEWRHHQWPLPPYDFDYAYWNCAPADQQVDFPPPGTRLVTAHLYGNTRREQVDDVALSEEAWAGLLPMHRLLARYRYTHIGGEGMEAAMNLDTLVIDMAAQQVYATYRVCTKAFDVDANLLIETHLSPAGQPDRSIPAAEWAPLRHL